MALIIEEINRAHRVHSRYRMEEERATMGRAFNNAVIVEDVHADPVHAEVVRDEDGCYLLRDLQSLNGIRLLRNHRDKSVKPAQVREHLIQSGDEVQIGKSYLRFTDTEESVAAAVPLHSAETVFDRLATPLVAIVLCLLAAAMNLWLAYNSSAMTLEWTQGVEVVTNTIIALLIYAAAWSLIGRVVRHEVHFLAHISIAAFAALIYTLWQWFSTLLDYNFSMSQVLPLLNILALAALIPFVLWCATYLALNITNGWRLAASILIPWGFLGLSAATQIREAAEFSEVPRVSKELKNKDLLWRKPVPLEEFLAEAPALFDIPIKEEDGSSADKSTPEKTSAPAEGEDNSMRETAPAPSTPAADTQGVQRA
ncbi:FHA domain-containing protein [uncultured Microbulbifer sp.]|uniref:FHA domain-containing protein n=1 Tax=uncultured Microbulbifer sp. TaxID=348147 RepID=UPI0025DB021A|nr:FHA domain-containing protein [uncultured Microbulbifer sp.]